MRRLILMIFFAGLLTPAGLHAQKVYKDGDKVILDMTVGAGMPKGAVTTEKKTWTYAPSTYNAAENGENGTLNATVFHKLEIAKSDYGSGSNWVAAYTGCKGWDHNGSSTGWRLPTQRELQMMYIFKPALVTLGVTAFSATYYWSATEISATNSWTVLFSNGGTSNHLKTTGSLRVRCVREIVTP